MAGESTPTAAELEREGLAALDRFIETFNSRDVAAWAATLSYPHVRVSPRTRAVVSPTTQTYVAAFSYDSALAMGWDHSAWDEKRVLHVSPDKIHAAGQWCRYDADGQRILPNSVAYVITRVDGRWGIQARFGVDSPSPDQREDQVKRARDALERFGLALGRGSANALEAATHFPYHAIRAGEVVRCENAGELIDRTGGFGTYDVREVVPLQVGTLGVNLAIRLEGARGARAEAMCLVTERDRDLRVAAGSLILHA